METKLVIDNNSQSVQEITVNDERLKKLISFVGNIEIPLRTDFYKSLVNSIVAQQLSAKVASIINDRLELISGTSVTPNKIMELSDEKLRETGISKRKISYLRDLTHKVINGQVMLDDLCFLTNDEVIQKLTTIKGIGQWTAEMFLIFSLGRKDVLSLNDIGLQRATKWLYELESNVDGIAFLKRKNFEWRPYGTIISLYLWEVVNRDFIIKYTNIYELN